MRRSKASAESPSARATLEATDPSLFLEAAPEGIAILHLDGSVLRVNPAFCQILGFSPEELEGHHLDELTVPPEKVPESLDFRKSALRGPQAALATQRRRRDGKIIEVCLSGAPILSAQKTIGIIIILRNITDQRTLDDQLLQSQKMEAIGRLVGNVSHDFNNLLTAIMVYCGLLTENLLPGTAPRQHAEEIYAAAEQGSELVGQLLSIARQRRLAPTLVSMSEILNDLADLLQRLVGEQIAVKIVSGFGVGLIEVDPTQIQQAILNLVLNARDAMPDGGSITIQTRSEALSKGAPIPTGRYVRVSISDTGFGMDDATRARIFEPFFSTKPPGKGTGLGLASVHAIVKQAGGHITVSTRPGRGSRFDLYFPETTSPTASEEEPAGRSRRPNRTGSETVLVVEDQDRVRNGIAGALEHGGYHVLTARDAEEALKVSRAHPNRIHLLLTDIVMPGLGGDQLADQLLQFRPDIKVIFMSGYNRRDPRLLSRSNAFFAEKPLRMTTLLRSIREVLDGVM
jgi:two-component system, cell cycle sensor histidine kinase and response regulator CckA